MTEEEPKFKYEKLTGSLTTLLALETPSVLLASSRMMVLGCESGSIFWLDLSGQVTRHQTKLHSSAITHLSLDETGEWLATSGKDGRILVQNLFDQAGGEVGRGGGGGGRGGRGGGLGNSNSNGNQQPVCTSDPPRICILDPAYGKTRAFVTLCPTTGCLALHTRGWLLQRLKETVIVRTGCTAIDWVRNLFVYATAEETRLSSSSSSSSSSSTAAPDSTSSVVVAGAGGAESVRIIGGGGGGLDRRILLQSSDRIKVVSVASLSILYSIAIIPPITSHPISPCPDHVLVFQPDRAELAIYKGPTKLQSDFIRKSVGGNIGPVSSLVPVKDTFTTTDQIYESGSFYLVCSDSIVLAKALSWQDRIHWRVAEGRFSSALDLLLSDQEQKEFIPGSQTHRAFVVETGRQILSHLARDEQNYPIAVQKAHFIFGQDPQGHYHALAPRHLPSTLAPATYTEIMQVLLLQEQKYDAFWECLSVWSNLISDHRSILATVSRVIMSLQEETECAGDEHEFQCDDGKADMGCLQESLAFLHLELNEPEQAIIWLIRRGHWDRTLALVERYSLYDTLLESLWNNREKRKSGRDFQLPSNQLHQSILLPFFIQHPDEMEPRKILDLLAPDDQQSFQYLHGLSQERGLAYCKDFHDQLLVWYADFEPGQLTGFLKSSNDYNLQRAYELCRERGLIGEVVFLLGRMGNQREALRVLMEEQYPDDPQVAIDFARSLGDADLWHDLIEYALDNRPRYIACLLRMDSSCIDPVDILQRIPAGLKDPVPELTATLDLLFQDLAVQIMLFQGSLCIFHSDSRDLTRDLNRHLTRGFKIDAGHACVVCSRSFLAGTGGSREKADTDIWLFRCGHAFHVGCLRTMRYLFPHSNGNDDWKGGDQCSKCQ